MVCSLNQGPRQEPAAEASGVQGQENACELQSTLLKGGYIGDLEYYKGMLGV